MFFNSIDFAVFFPLFLIFYWLTAKKLGARNLVILTFSYIFYGWWDWRFLSLIIISSVVDFIIGQKLYKAKNQSVKKKLLFLSLFINLGFLVYFKYANFFIDSFINTFKFFGADINSYSLHIILPVGISFYTFQTLSYTIDIYRGQLKPTKNWLAFFSFVAFFPQLVAGPIERASHLLPQFYKIYTFNYKRFKSGMLLVAFGLFKKMVLADRLAILVNQVYNNPLEYQGLEIAIATLFFAFQIYCDFSGYSDIAIGIARTLGFDLMKNFNTPYFSKSITEFWRRWHISLSTWFRDYVYIPLGGSRVKEYRVYLNLFIVFVVSGLWHGAAITFIIWGGIHGLIIVFEKFLNNHNYIVNRKKPINQVFFTITTFLIVCIAWIFFRANNLYDSIYFIKNIFNFKLYSIENIFKLGLPEHEFYAAILFIVLLLFFESFNKRQAVTEIVYKLPVIFRWSIYVIITYILIIFGVYGELTPKEFIYFQF